MTKRVHCLSPGPAACITGDGKKHGAEQRVGIHPSAADDQAGTRQSRQVGTGTFPLENYHIGN